MHREKKPCLLALAIFTVIFLPVTSANAKCDGKTTTIPGTSGADTINGTQGADVIEAFGGADIINGKAGSDTICGNGSADDIFGSTGADDIFGGTGVDDLDGGAGVDYLIGNDKADTVRGGPGSDIVIGGKKLSDEADQLFGEGHNDQVSPQDPFSLFESPETDALCDGGSGSNDFCELSCGTFISCELL